MIALKIAAMGVVAASLAVLIRNFRPELAIQVGLVCGVLVLLYAIDMLSGIKSTIIHATEEFGLNTEYIEIIFKVIGLAYITQFSAQLCRDSGESAIADKVELIGRLVIVAMVLPLVFSILATMQELIVTG